jgi:hypothetical protein
VFRLINTNYISPALHPPSFPLSHFMCSQSGNIQDIVTYSGHSPSCMIETDVEPDCSSKQEYHNSPTLPSDMGLRYMTIPATDDVRLVLPVHWLSILVIPSATTSFKHRHTISSPSSRFKTDLMHPIAGLPLYKCAKDDTTLPTTVGVFCRSTT